MCKAPHFQFELRRVSSRSSGSKSHFAYMRTKRVKLSSEQQQFAIITTINSTREISGISVHNKIEGNI